MQGKPGCPVVGAPQLGDQSRCQFLHNCSESLVCIPCNKLDLFLVGVVLSQGSPLSSELLLVKFLGLVKGWRVSDMVLSGLLLYILQMI